MKQTLRIAILLTFACAAVAAFSNFAQAQKVDLAFGISTVDAPGASSASGESPAPCRSPAAPIPALAATCSSGTISVSAAKSTGRQHQGNYGGDPTLPFRPIFLDFNAVYAPKLASHTYLELIGGIGALDTRYLLFSNAAMATTPTTASDKHFMGDFGAGTQVLSQGRLLRPSRGANSISSTTTCTSVPRASPATASPSATPSEDTSRKRSKFVILTERSRGGRTCCLPTRQRAGPSALLPLCKFFALPPLRQWPVSPVPHYDRGYEFRLLRRDDLPVFSGADPFRPQENAGDRPPGRALPQRVPARFLRIPLADRVRNQFPRSQQQRQRQLPGSRSCRPSRPRSDRWPIASSIRRPPKSSKLRKPRKPLPKPAAAENAAAVETGLAPSPEPAPAPKVAPDA